jgi:outer membrane protein assembly factor BamB
MSAGPIVDDRQVYVPHQTIDNVQFVVLDTDTGTKRWEYTDDRHQMVPAHTPTLDGERLYLVDTDDVGSVNTRKRETAWYQDLTDHANDPPNFGSVRVANGTAYVGTHTGFVFAFDAETGDRQWTYDVPGYTGPVSDRSDEAVVAARRRGAVNAPLAVTDQRVYASSWNYTLHALDATTGELDWSFSPGTNNLNAMRAPAVVGEEVYVQTKDARLFVLDRKSGQRKWSFDDIGVATNGVSPLVDDKSVYIVAGTSTENLFLVALDREGGSVRWKRSIGPPYRSPVGDANTVYIDYDDGLHAIDKTDGEKKWTLRLNGELAAPATVVDWAVYAADTSGNLYGVW